MSHLDTWEGTLEAPALDALIARVDSAILIGQRPGDFSLGRALVGGVAAWPSGRCFNEDLEILWWSAGEESQRNAVILNRLPTGWTPTETLTYRPAPLADGIAMEEARYLCVGQYDARASAGPPLWWEPRYGRTFEYLPSAPPVPAPGKERGNLRSGRQGRVYLHAVVYELADGRTQHRLVRFEHAQSE